MQPVDILLTGHAPVMLAADDAARFLTGLRRRGTWPDASHLAVYGPPPTPGSCVERVLLELRLREGANQQALVTRARQLLPPTWRTRTEPAFLAAERCLRFATLATPDPAELEPRASQLEAETGFRLVLQTPRR